MLNISNYWVCVALTSLVLGCSDNSAETDASGGDDVGGERRAEGCRLFTEGGTSTVTAGDLDDRAALIAPGIRTTVTLVPGRGLPDNTGWLDLGTIDETELYIFLGADERPSLFRVLTQVGPTSEEIPLRECEDDVARFMAYRNIDPNPGYKLTFRSTKLEQIDVLYLAGDGS